MSWHWQWHSRRGSERRSNADAGGLLNETASLYAVIVDANEPEHGRDDMATTLLRQLFNACASAAPAPPVERLLAALEATHAALRRSYPTHCAAYAVLVLDDSRQQAWAVTAGDCRIGYQPDTGQVEWLTPVDTAANWSAEDFTLDHARQPERHTLTRCMKATRLAPPHVEPLHWQPSGTWHLATDGEWIERRLLGQEIATLCDDASTLLLARQPFPAPGHSDSDNWISPHHSSTRTAT